MLLKGAGGTAQPVAMPQSQSSIKATRRLSNSLTRQVHTPWQEAEVSAAGISEGGQSRTEKKKIDGHSYLGADSSYSQAHEQSPLRTPRNNLKGVCEALKSPQ